MAASPDGPWFFLIAQSEPDTAAGPEYRLTGITDTSMLRPQVFAWQESELAGGDKVAIGFAASEKQVIDAALESLAETDSRFWTRADRCWNARGGSHTDGGAFFFNVSPNGKGMDLTVTDKFGQAVPVPTSTPAFMTNGRMLTPSKLDIPRLSPTGQFAWFKGQLPKWGYPEVLAFLEGIELVAREENDIADLLNLLTLMMDKRYDTGKLRRSSLLSLFDRSFNRVVEMIKESPSPQFVYHAARDKCPRPLSESQTVVIDASGFTPEGETSVAREIHRLYETGFKNFIVAHTGGHRFIGSGLGVDTRDVRIDVYGSPGDYLASGLDGLELHVHNNGQDQVAQIMKSGKLVVHGDVGQTFMYGAKGGSTYILGNAAGRPLINAVGKPRVVINGTCLDYLAESFMAGDPLNGGGFVILNGITFDEHNHIMELDTPYPGGNLFSLASGGGIYVRDVFNKVSEDQLNGGELLPLTPEDWALIEPYLQENERLFDITLDRLLSVNGTPRKPEQVYRKIRPNTVRALQAEEAWVTKES
jgi:glutamate synthase domain-containing protein 3